MNIPMCPARGVLGSFIHCPVSGYRDLGLIPWCAVTIDTGFIVILDYVQEKMYKMRIL